MNFKSMIMMVGAMVIFAAINVNAQSQDDSRVKILRTANAGVVKLLYAINTDEPLTVKFSNRNGEIITDRIEGQYPKGFLKHYNVKGISNSDFWIEVASSQMVLTYRIVPSQDGKSFTSHLERTVYNHQPLAMK
jgi:hypothetical protein